MAEQSGHEIPLEAAANDYTDHILAHRSDERRVLPDED
jgi:hypothetical protein